VLRGESFVASHSAPVNTSPTDSDKSTPRFAPEVLEFDAEVCVRVLACVYMRSRACVYVCMRVCVLLCVRVRARACVCLCVCTYILHDDVFRFVLVQLSKALTYMT